MTTLDDIGEAGVIKRIRERLSRRPDVLTGAGDDCAVVKASPGSAEDELLTSDAVIEGAHFEAGASPEAVGHKAIGRVLSDIAAMGGQPRWALVNIAAPPSTPVSTIDGVYKGACALAGQHGLTIVGGDTAASPCFQLHVFATGSVPAGAAVLRSGAQPGDILFVTGTLGGSPQSKRLVFEPRVREGAWLRDWASAMIDISDGLASDVRHIADESGVGVRLDLAALPLAPETATLGGGRSPIEHAMRDGEDFELLFTIPPDREKEFAASWPNTFEALPCTAIGAITPRAGTIDLIDKDGTKSMLDVFGYEHFGGAHE